MKSIYVFIFIGICGWICSCGNAGVKYDYDYKIEVADDGFVRIDGRLVSMMNYENFLDSLSQLSVVENLRLMFVYDEDVAISLVKDAKRVIRKHNRKFDIVYENGIMVRLPPNMIGEIDFNLLKDRNVFHIGLINEDSVYIDGEVVVDVQDAFLMAELTKFIESDPEDDELPSLSSRSIPNVGLVYLRNRYIVIVESRDSVPMNLYDRVMGICHDSYGAVQEKLSREYFGVSYDSLDNNQKEVMKTILPRVMGEVNTKYFEENMRKSL